MESESGLYILRAPSEFHSSVLPPVEGGLFLPICWTYNEDQKWSDWGCHVEMEEKLNFLSEINALLPDFIGWLDDLSKIPEGFELIMKYELEDGEILPKICAIVQLQEVRTIEWINGKLISKIRSEITRHIDRHSVIPSGIFSEKYNEFSDFLHYGAPRGWKFLLKDKKK